MPDAVALPVSVVIPAYRAEAYVRSAVASVCDDVVPREIIVVDDASPDRTAQAAAAAGARVIRHEHNRGPSAARNTGAAAATQPWVAFLDADDTWLRGKLAAQWVALCRWPDAGFCFTEYDAVYEDGRVVEAEASKHPGYRLLAIEQRAPDAVRFDQESFIRGFLRSMFVRQSSAIVSRKLFAAVGGYDPEMRIGEDYELFLRLAGKGPVIAVERSFVRYHRRAGSVSEDRLAEIAGVERLWETILRKPGNYPAAALEYVRAHRTAPHVAGCALALRLGRFTEAAALARRARMLGASGWSVAAEVVAQALDTPVGVATYRSAHALWRARSARTRRAPSPTLQDDQNVDIAAAP